ncbi:DUF7501 family protein [Halobacterium yunchengense]|uniref:DUF7501 family protein n=1 Tax=Halobacterium yunchengense TaxID=3108497 RepID=UPI0030086E3A
MPLETAWGDPNQCPFCGGDLPSPGSGFVDHVDDNPDCSDAFDAWRGRVARDVPRGWPG